MKINAEELGRQLKGILDEDGLSVVELAAKTGISRDTLYSIVEGKRGFAQRATMRKIAEATGRSFVISGDSVTFSKILEAKNGDLTEEEQQFLAMFRQLDDTAQDAAIDLLESMCRVAELGRQKRKERSNSSEN
ncbi:MAG TPA: helix-turn-helix transcriptional regulator [bacterium]|nr:helix-turn-helix transcriptional regulator [bacterium]